MIRLLFIDDDPKDQKLLKMVLDEEYAIRSAYAAGQGLELAAAETPDVVLLDVNLPDRSGLEVLPQILELPSAPMVVMLTVFNDIRLVVSAIKSGAYDYIVRGGGPALSPVDYYVDEIGGSVCVTGNARLVATKPRPVAGVSMLQLSSMARDRMVVAPKAVGVKL